MQRSKQRRPTPPPHRPFYIEAIRPPSPRAPNPHTARTLQHGAAHIAPILLPLGQAIAVGGLVMLSGKSCEPACGEIPKKHPPRYTPSRIASKPLSCLNSDKDSSATHEKYPDTNLGQKRPRLRTQNARAPTETITQKP